MALKNLSSETMLALSTSWLDPGRGRKALEDHPRATHYLADLAAAHSALLAASASPDASALPPEMIALSAEETEVDTLHDRKVRGLHLVLTGLAELTDDRAEAARLLGARDTLFPDGISINQRSYLDEAGNVSAVARRLDSSPETRALLLHTPLPHGKKLDDEVLAWLDTGERLGKLEARRVGLLHDRDASRSGSKRGDLLRARNRWSRVTHAFLAAIDLDDHPGDALEKNFIRPLREAEAKADRRAAPGPDPDASDPTEPPA